MVPLRGRITMNNRMVPIVGSLATALLVLGLGVAALHFFFGPDVQRVDPAVLPELRAIGRVIGEDADIGHQWKNSYVEFKYLVIYLDGNVKEDILAEAEQRLNRNGWRVWTGESDDIELESARWDALVGVEPFEREDYVSSELREAVAATGLPMNRMVYITVQG